MSHIPKKMACQHLATLLYDISRMRSLKGVIKVSFLKINMSNL